MLASVLYSCEQNLTNRNVVQYFKFHFLKCALRTEVYLQKFSKIINVWFNAYFKK